MVRKGSNVTLFPGLGVSRCYLGWVAGLAGSRWRPVVGGDARLYCGQLAWPGGLPATPGLEPHRDLTRPPRRCAPSASEDQTRAMSSVLLDFITGKGEQIVVGGHSESCRYCTVMVLSASVTVVGESTAISVRWSVHVRVVPSVTART